MGFWTDAKFNSLTVLVAALAPLAVGVPLAVRTYGSQPASFRGCPYPVLKGMFRSAMSDAYPFEYDIESNKLTAVYPNGSGPWVAKGNDIACKDGSVFLMRDGELAVGGTTYPRTCYHYGILLGRTVSGHYACQQVAEDRNQDFSWTAEFYAKQ